MLSTARQLHTDEIERQWVYDTGAAWCFIGWNFLTEEEKLRTYEVDEITFTTGNGLYTTSTAVMCNVPLPWQASMLRNG